MTIIKTTGRLFEHLFPLIREQEQKGLKYLRDEDDGAVGIVGVSLLCARRVYFDDGKETVTYEDRTAHIVPNLEKIQREIKAENEQSRIKRRREEVERPTKEPRWGWLQRLLFLDY